MVLCLFGENCVGKSYIADALKETHTTTIYTGKDYLRLAKNEQNAIAAFQQTLKEHVTDNDLIIYVVSELQQLSFVPEGAKRVLVTADLDTIKERFTKRLHGNLPAPVAMMLERNHGRFDNEAHDLKIDSNTVDAVSAVEHLLK